MLPRAPSGNYDHAVTQEMYVGLEYDFFADFRKSVDEAGYRWPFVQHGHHGRRGHGSGFPPTEFSPALPLIFRH